MVLTFIIAVLTACGLLFVSWLLLEAISIPVPYKELFHVVHLNGNAARVEQTVKSCLRLREFRGLRGKLIFVDGGLDPEAQMAVALLLRDKSDALLCANTQIAENIRWETENLGAGAD